MERRLSGELTRLDCEGQFKPFVYLNCRDGRTHVPLCSNHQAKKKSPAFSGTFLLSSVQVRTNVRPYAADWGSDPDGSDLAAAVRASGRRPAAGRASPPGSDSAGPDSGSGWTLVSPWLNVAGNNRRIRNWFQGTFGSAGIIAGGGSLRLWRTEPRDLKLAMYKPLSRASCRWRTGLPLLENDTTRRSSCQGQRRVITY